jgi:hypothetical protein
MTDASDAGHGEASDLGSNRAVSGSWPGLWYSPPHSLDSEFLTPFHRLKATQARINHAAMNAAPPIGVSTPSQGVPVSASA